MRTILPLLLCLALPAGAQTVASAPVAYTMVPDSVSGAVLPRLVDASDPRTRRVNRQLDSLSASLRCVDAVDQFGNATEHWSDAKIAYAADGILSVHVRFGGFCGGAHPINGVNVSVTYDLRTGKEVPFPELFANYERDAHAIVRVFFPAQVVAAERFAKEGREPEPGGEEECLQLYTPGYLANNFFAYTLSDAGLVVEPSFGHVATACREEVVVPYEDLRPYAAPDGLLARLVGRP